jgi:hypothetical protein
MTPSPAQVEIHPDSIAAEVAMAKKAEEEMPSVAPSDSDSYTNSLIDDESYESLETEDQTLQEWSMFPKVLKVIATLKSAKNCNVDIKPEEIGDEWLDFVDKKIMPALRDVKPEEIGDEWLDFVDKKITPALKTSVACGGIDDGFLSVNESTAVLTAVSTNCEELEVEETFTMIEEKVKKAAKEAKKAAKKAAKQSRQDVEDEMQRARLIKEYIEMLKMHEDDSPFVQSLIKKNPYMHSAGQQPSKAKNFSWVTDAATDTIFPVVAAE